MMDEDEGFVTKPPPRGGLLGNYLSEETLLAVYRGTTFERSLPSNNDTHRDRDASRDAGAGRDAGRDASRDAGAGRDAVQSADMPAVGIDDTTSTSESAGSAASSQPPNFCVGNCVELCNLTGVESGWNGKLGTVSSMSVSMHPEIPGRVVWAVEIDFFKPIPKTSFFSENCRLVEPGEIFSPLVAPKKPKKVKPNAPCPCGSKKKYKKCCGRKNNAASSNSDPNNPSSSVSSTNRYVHGNGSETSSAMRANLGALRFKVGDKILAFAGKGEWMNGTIIKLWDQGNPYRIELEDGTNVWGPEDTSNFVRSRIIGRNLRFRVGDRVLANALGGWKPGRIIRVWDHGNPYRIELDDGTNVWGPDDIDKFVRELRTK